MCFQISPSTINTSTITSMLILGITRNQVLNRKVVCDLTTRMNCYSICCNTCFERNFVLLETNNYLLLFSSYCESVTEIIALYFLSVNIFAKEFGTICQNLKRVVKLQSTMSNFTVIL